MFLNDCIHKLGDFLKQIASTEPTNISRTLNEGTSKCSLLFYLCLHLKIGFPCSENGVDDKN